MCKGFKTASVIPLLHSNKDLQRGDAVLYTCIPNCDGQHRNYDGMLEHFVLFRVTSCDIMPCFWLVYIWSILCFSVLVFCCFPKKTSV